ncbi:unnamed protein product, partial [Staurois parvus]
RTTRKCSDTRVERIAAACGFCRGGETLNLNVGVLGHSDSGETLNLNVGVLGHSHSGETLNLNVILHRLPRGDKNHQCPGCWATVTAWTWDFSSMSPCPWAPRHRVMASTDHPSHAALRATVIGDVISPC